MQPVVKERPSGLWMAFLIAVAIPCAWTGLELVPFAWSRGDRFVAVLLAPFFFMPTFHAIQVACRWMAETISR
jgi:hypothetical protein